jgi:hypothetical protein
VKRILLLCGVSIGAFLIGTIAFSIRKACKWAKLFEMSYGEFSHSFGRAVKMLMEGVPPDEIHMQTGIDFTNPELEKYFPVKSYLLDNDEDEAGLPRSLKKI